MARQLLKAGRRIESPFSGLRYEIRGWLGGGGFGQVYSAWELDRRGRPKHPVCLKVSEDQQGWHREAYFGELLLRHPRVIQVYDTFALPAMVGGVRTTLYYLALEWAEHGSLTDHLKETGNRAWPVGRARREIIALLKVLNTLHGASATHRDLTPMNVFVCEGDTLKLGDFGVARHTLGGTARQALTWNEGFVGADFRGLPSDDVFLVGQLFAMLLLGDATQKVTRRQVEGLRAPEDVKAGIMRAIGPKSRRFADAYEMLAALEGREASLVRAVGTLRGKRVAFAGKLSAPRPEAELRLMQIGGSVAHRVSRTTDVLVVGSPARAHLARGPRRDPIVTAALALKRRGSQICLVGEPEFWRLVRQPRRA